MSLPSKWPYIVKVGNVQIPIYRAKNTKGDTAYDEFKVVYYHQTPSGDRKRRFKTCASFDDACRFAENVNAAINAGDVHTLVLTGDERLEFLNAKKAAGDRALLLVVSEYMEAIGKLKGVPLSVAVDGYLKSHGKFQPRTVREVIAELIASKEQNKMKPLSAEYLKDLGRLWKFAAAFNVSISEITATEIEEYIASIDATGRTQFNYGRLVRTLFNFAEKRNYLPKDSNPFEEIELEYLDEGEIEIFTPDEMRGMLLIARPELVPFLAIGGFAGVRHYEMKRLDWSDIGAEHITIKKGTAKTRSRRLVPILPNLAKWLEPHRKKTGPVIGFAHISKQLGWLVEDMNAAAEMEGRLANFRWKHNALRHSFISYRMSVTNNENQVAVESGNSPAKIHSNYRELVMPVNAQEWFAIAPAVTAAVSAL